MLNASMWLFATKEPISLDFPVSDETMAEMRRCHWNGNGGPFAIPRNWRKKIIGLPDEAELRKILLFFEEGGW